MVISIEVGGCLWDYPKSSLRLKTDEVLPFKFSTSSSLVRPEERQDMTGLGKLLENTEKTRNRIKTLLVLRPLKLSSI